jgi:putative transposase
VKPAQRRPLVQFLRVGFRVSERRACRTLDYHRKTIRYRSRAKDQTPLRLRLRELAAVRVCYGYRRLHTLLRREGWHVNHKRVYRLYRQEGLSVRSVRRQKRVSALRPLLPVAQAPKEQWSMDFMSDSLASGQRFRLLTLEAVPKAKPSYRGHSIRLNAPSADEEGRG